MADTKTDAILRLDETVIGARLVALPDWSRSGDELQRTFACGDFLKAMAFVNEVAEVAETTCHHPDILVRYSKVTLSLSTHDAGGLTDKDFELAAIFDGLRGG